jgi:AraC-like DNA-binding protein
MQMPVTSIAFALGYADASGFTRPSGAQRS